MLQDKLRYAIAHCKAIDTDFSARGPQADDSEEDADHDDSHQYSPVHARLQSEGLEDHFGQFASDSAAEREVDGPQPQSTNAPCCIS